MFVNVRPQPRTNPLHSILASQKIWQNCYNATHDQRACFSHKLCRTDFKKNYYVNIQLKIHQNQRRMNTVKNIRKMRFYG